MRISAERGSEGTCGSPNEIAPEENRGRCLSRYVRQPALGLQLLAVALGYLGGMSRSAVSG